MFVPWGRRPCETDAMVTMRFVGLAGLLLAVLVGCATPDANQGPKRTPADVRAQLVRLMPAKTPDREGWAREIQTAFASIDVPPSSENLCAVLAVIEQESGYVADPAVPGLARIAREEIDRRAAKLKVPQFLVRAALDVDSANGKTYAQRLAGVRTEQELSRLFEEFLASVPLGKRLFGRANPVRTGGPMQVGIRFAETYADGHRYPYADAGSIRQEVFSRRGGLYFGIAHLLDYPNSYERHLYRYADFNAGWYASRNAAFQAALARAAGIELALDGDLIVHAGGWGKRKIGVTERAALSIADELELDERAIQRDLDQGDRFEFEQTDLYHRVFALADRRAGQPLPRAVIPRILLESPKITRKLTTEWFATRVQKRYQACIGKALAG